MKTPNKKTLKTLTLIIPPLTALAWGGLKAVGLAILIIAFTLYIYERTTYGG